MVWEVLLNILFGKVLYEIGFIDIVWVFAERSAEIWSTSTDGSDIFLFEDVLWGGCIFVAQVDALGDLIDFRVFHGA